MTLPAGVPTSSSWAPALAQRSLQLARVGLNGRALQGVLLTRFAHGGCAGRHRRLAGNMSEDNWHYHFYDTIKGSDWLATRTPSSSCAAKRPRSLHDLEHMACPSTATRTAPSTSVRLAAYTANYGESPCSVRLALRPTAPVNASRTRSYQQNVKERNAVLSWSGWR